MTKKLLLKADKLIYLPCKENPCPKGLDKQFVQLVQVMKDVRKKMVWAIYSNQI